MFKNLLKKNTITKLGRWGVTYDHHVLEKRINWANHDHCGSEICENYFNNENNSERNSKTKTNNTDKNAKKETTSWENYIKKKKSKSTQITNTNKILEQEYFLPYCL